MYRTGLSCLLVLLCLILRSQDIPAITEENADAIYNSRVAEQLFNAGLYFEAIPYYESLTARPENTYNYSLLFNLAECYRHSRYYYKAKQLYKKISEYALTRFPESLLWLALMEQSLEQYGAAIENYRKYLDYAPEKRTDLISFAEQQIRVCQTADGLRKQSAFARTEMLPATVNGYFSTFSTCETLEGIWFSAITPVKRAMKMQANGIKGKYSSLLLSRIYLAPQKNLKWQSRKLVPLPLPEELDHVSAPFYHTGDSCLYYMICAHDSLGLCRIYRSRYANKKLSAPELLPAPVNLPGSSSRHPALFTWKDHTYMFFSSNRAGGYGQYDIYFCEVLSSGEYYRITNAGKTINTPANEITPFFDIRQHQLYFSSDRSSGFGQYDIYRSSGIPHTGFSEAVNIGFPANSGADDYYFTASVNDTGVYFFSSNRYQNRFRNEATCCDKIYMLTRISRPLQSCTLLGYITDSNGIKLQDARIQISDTFNNLIDTGIVQQGYYTAKVPFSGVVTLMVSAPDYLFTIDRLQLTGECPVTRNFILSRIETGAMAVLRNIYFEKDRSTLLPESYIALNAIADFLLQYPHLTVEISGHTDCTGSREYNLRLSESRAQSVIDYLVTRGVPSHTLVARGYGYDRPCSGNDTPEGRKANRRVEFRIIKK